MTTITHQALAAAPEVWSFADQQGKTELICRQVIAETHDVKTFVFQTEKSARFTFKAGQFITIDVNIEGETVSRSYTISSSPSRPYSLALTIKKVDGGKVSGWLLENLKVGDKLSAMAPAGVFNIEDITANKVLFLSAGCGVTPMMSMSRWLMDTCADVDVLFVHSARSADDIIFQSELRQVERPSRNFQHHYVLEDKEGYLTEERLQQLVPDLHSRTVFVCGPAPYMSAMEAMVSGTGFNMEHFHQESFGGVLPTADDDVVAETFESTDGIVFTMENSGKAITVNPGDSVLDALESQQAPIIAACRTGVCGACKIQVLEGDVSSTSQMTLTPQEIEQGYVLACCSTVDSSVSVAI